MTTPTTTPRESISTQLDRASNIVRSFETPRNLEQEEAAWLAKFRQRRQDGGLCDELAFERDSHGVRRFAAYMPQYVLASHNVVYQTLP